MEHLVIREAELEDVPAFDLWLSKECRDEIRRYSGRTPLVALPSFIDKSARAWVAYLEDRPLAIWGVVRWSLLTGAGSPWAFMTGLAGEHPLFVARASRTALKMIRGTCPGPLAVDVDAQFTKAANWLEWLGFKLEGPEPKGPKGDPFYKATLGELPRGIVERLPEDLPPAKWREAHV